MISYFSVSISFIDPRFHGRKDGGKPEWPPSPLRLFQALVASAARMGKGGLTSSHQAALCWLERMSLETSPLIIAPNSLLPGPQTPGYCLSVPNNAMDIVARTWSHGNYSNSGDASPATHRTMKTVRPVYMIGGSAVYYLWQLNATISDEVGRHISELSAIAHSINVLGWGVDLVVGKSDIFSENDISGLAGERWMPFSGVSVDGLRVPVKGTTDDLVKRHGEFLKRMDGNIFTPPSPLSVFNMISYRRATDPPKRPIAVFSLVHPATGKLRAFDTARWALTISGMTRHAASCAAERTRLPEKQIGEFILGHGESLNTGKHISVGNRRFSYLPLPSIEPRGDGQASVVGNIRRLMLTVFEGDCEKEIAWARRMLPGQMLEAEQSAKDGESTDKNEPIAMLSPLPESDNVVISYIRPSATWATVTPVVLPGYDDPSHYRRRLKNGVAADVQKRLLIRLHERVDGLIRKTIVQSGFSKVLADNAEIEWRKIGFWRGTEPVDRYGVPDHLKRFPRYHVRIMWRDENQQPVNINGPICIGGGRFYGLGLFAAEF